MMCAILRTRLLHAIFGEAGFELHKWHCNEQTLESEANSEQEDEKQKYEKEQLGVKSGETEMLGLHWDKLQGHDGSILPSSPPPPPHPLK